MENGASNSSDFQTVSEQSGLWKGIREWIQVIILALIIALPIRHFVATPFVVQGASMDPTFSTGQFLIVDRMTYRLEDPKRGDVIVFEYPNDPSIYYIKRIIGLPGEKISIKDGKVSANDQLISEPYVDPIHATDDTSERTLGGTEYFVMGDNRSQSSDSRAWGPLDKHFIVGRPVVRLTPLSAIALFPGENHDNLNIKK